MTTRAGSGSGSIIQSYPGSATLLFTTKFFTKLSKICVTDPGSGKHLFRIPDPGVEKAPDPGSATLHSIDKTVSNADPDPNPPDPHVIGPPVSESGSISQSYPDPYVFGPPIYRSVSSSHRYGSGSFFHQAKTSLMHESTDPETYKNGMDLPHWIKLWYNL